MDSIFLECRPKFQLLFQLNKMMRSGNSLTLLLVIMLAIQSLAFRVVKPLAVTRTFSHLLSQHHFVNSHCSRLFCTSIAESGGNVAKNKNSEISLMEIRVGKIVGIERHAEADGLYVEQVDCGESTGPRTIVSGLVAFCTTEQLLNSRVTVLCNLKPRAIKGITSHGMLLCASNADHTQVQPLIPSDSTQLGELITFDGFESAPIEPGNRASKAYSKIADDFFVNDDGIATFSGIPFSTTQGPIKCSLKGKIS